MIEPAMYISIAVMYNIFIHYLANVIYKDKNYEEKIRNSTALIVIASILAIVISNVLENKLIKKGLLIGGVILMLTIIMANWERMEDGVKIIASGGCLLGLIWYSCKREKKIEKKNR